MNGTSNGSDGRKRVVGYFERFEGGQLLPTRPCTASTATRTRNQSGQFTVVVDELERLIVAESVQHPLDKLGVPASVLLWMILRSVGRPLLHEDLLRRVHGGDQVVDASTVHAYRQRLSRVIPATVLSGVLIALPGRRRWIVSKNWNWAWIRLSHDSGNSELVAGIPHHATQD